jgi:hypothetical protein
MKSIFDFVITPKKSRYKNTKNIGDKKLILNTEIFNHQYVSRNAIISELPTAYNTELKEGDEVIIHHNIFRRWHDLRGDEKNSRGFLNENEYLAQNDQVFAYKRNNIWKARSGYCFVTPIQSNDKFNTEIERPLIGIMKYTDNDLPNINNGDLVGFTPDNEFEFIIDGERLYRVLTKDISIKYEYQGDEKEYNPSWS